MEYTVYCHRCGTMFNDYVGETEELNAECPHCGSTLTLHTDLGVENNYEEIKEDFFMKSRENFYYEK
jgi:rRNA maturation endonuclease Nob1